MTIEREQFCPVLDKDVMLDILADHVRNLSNREKNQITKAEEYQRWAKNVGTRTFDYGYKIFDLTEKLQNGKWAAETELYQTYVCLLSECYRESFDCIQLVPQLPENVKSFLQQAPAAFEPISVPQVDFATGLNFDLTSEERFFDQRISATLDTIANLVTRALAVKYSTLKNLSPIRINAHIRNLAKIALELISGHQTILLYGASNPATQNVKTNLLSKFFNEAGNLEILKYMEEGRMFSDSRFEGDKKAREAFLLMTGLFDLKPLYIK
jgi:hypothetical protein